MAGYREGRILRINTRNLLNLYLPTLILFVISFGILYYLKFDRYLVQIFLIFWTLDLLPALYLHIQYWLANRGEEYEIHSDAIIRYKNGQEQVYPVSDIDHIKVYMSPALYKGSNFHLLGIEAYNFAWVRLKNGQDLIITCLLAPKVDKALRGLRGITIERKKRVFNPLDWKW